MTLSTLIPVKPLQNNVLFIVFMLLYAVSAAVALQQNWINWPTELFLLLVQEQRFLLHTKELPKRALIFKVPRNGPFLYYIFVVHTLCVPSVMGHSSSIGFPRHCGTRNNTSIISASPLLQICALMEKLDSEISPLKETLALAQ